jgi:hypothetical protein
MRSVQIEGADGQPLVATYTVADGWISVQCHLGTQSAALHKSDPAGLARLLLAEIAGKATRIERN